MDMVRDMANPVIVKVTRLSTLLPVETPERPAVVPNLPTTSRSTAPYIAWRTRAPNTGSMKARSFLGMLPVVKSADAFSVISFIFIFSHYYLYTLSNTSVNRLSVFADGDLVVPHERCDFTDRPGGDYGFVVRYVLQEL